MMSHAKSVAGGRTRRRTRDCAERRCHVDGPAQKRPLPLSERSRSSDSLKDHLAEEVHDQFDNVRVKILQRNILARRRRRKPRTEVSGEAPQRGGELAQHERGEKIFFVMFTPSSALAQRASQELSTACEDSKDEIRQQVTQQETSTCSFKTSKHMTKMRQCLVRMGVPAHDEGACGLTAGRAHHHERQRIRECSLTKNNILTRITLLGKAR